MIRSLMTMCSLRPSVCANVLGARHDAARGNGRPKLVCSMVPRLYHLGCVARVYCGAVRVTHDARAAYHLSAVDRARRATATIGNRGLAHLWPACRQDFHPRALRRVLGLLLRVSQIPRTR